MKISVIGTGYVGLVTGACFAEMGNEVVCLDADAAKIRLLAEGGMPIHEPGLPDMVRRNAAAGRLRFTTDVERSVSHGAIQFVAVGTPPDEDGSTDLQHVVAAARDIGWHMTDYKVVAIKSTVPVGTADKVRAALAEELAKRGAATPFSVASNPEFLKEGAAVEDFMRPDRVIIGTGDDRAAQLLRALYAPYTRNHDRLMFMDIRSAELTKHAANAMLATRISFMNELANLAESVGADIESVRIGIGSDSRIGYSFIYAGCGYGGSCLPKDVKALIHMARANGHELKVVDAADRANAAQKHVLGGKIARRFGKSLEGRRFAIWGLAFKPNTDDMREAASREIISDLLQAGAAVAIYDPVAMVEARRVLGDDRAIRYAASPIEACDGADALVIVTEWKEFRSPDFPAIKSRLKSPVIFDGRNLYDPAGMAAQGFEYFGIGRGNGGKREQP
jgi:UDPglucose 6-dehydrogenase